MYNKNKGTRTDRVRTDDSRYRTWNFKDDRLSAKLPVHAAIDDYTASKMHMNTCILSTDITHYCV